MFHLLAAPVADPNVVLLNYGAVGALLVIFVAFSWLTIKRERKNGEDAVNRERERADRLERLLQEKNDQLVEVAERVVELAKGSRDALIEANDYLRDLSHTRRRT